MYAMEIKDVIYDVEKKMQHIHNKNVITSFKQAKIAYINNVSSLFLFNLLSANKSLRCIEKRGISLPSFPLLNFAPYVFGGLCCSHPSFLVVSCLVACCIRVLSWRSLSRLVSVMSCLVLSLLVFLVLPCFVLSSLSCPVLLCWVLFHFVLSSLILPCVAV